MVSRLVDADKIRKFIKSEINPYGKPFEGSVYEFGLKVIGYIDSMANGGTTLKITKCTGEGQGSCKRCSDNGMWNRNWMSFLYNIEGYEGCYCEYCVKEIQEEVGDKGARV